MTARLGPRAEWSKHFFAEAACRHFGGGNSNLLADRSNLSLVVGTAFQACPLAGRNRSWLGSSHRVLAEAEEHSAAATTTVRAGHRV